jgi:hypothetical protein
MSVKFVAVRKDVKGQITQLLTDDGRAVSIVEARRMAHRGDVDSITDLHADGTWTIDDELQHEEGSNLGHLPEF